MERRVLIAVLLSFLVLYGYQALVPPPPDAAKGPQAAGPAAAAQPKSAAESTAAGATRAEREAPPPANEPPALVADSAERDIVVDNPAVHALFSTRGGVLKSWRLKKYTDTGGQPLELVATNGPPGAARPFTLTLDDSAATSRLTTALYQPSADALNISAGQQSLKFEFRDAGGLDAQKTFTFDRDHPYVIGFTAVVTRNGQPLNPTVEWGPALGSGIVLKTRSYNPPPQPLFYKDGKVSRVSPAKIAQQPAQDGVFGFAGVDDHYFLSALVAPPPPLHVRYQALDVPVEGTPDGAHYVAWSARFAAPPQGAQFFFGPKDFDVLASVNRDLVRSIDFGIFAWLVVPLLRALKWLNGYIGNYGWSLITLTVLINVAMFPLRHKSVVSMRKMQEIQPEVKAIQDRYAKLKMSDPARQKMNVELMNLYRERGVNPASGCIPMVLTMPVLFAFYSLLGVAIELRGAPFMWWIHDLSSHDPYFITPILMGVTMLVQQRMTPTSTDPMQQKMMLIMPIMFTGMFLWAASGLTIYWTVSNLWGIGQQMITNRLIGPAPQRNLRPPAERRVKRIGGGRTDQAASKE